MSLILKIRKNGKLAGTVIAVSLSIWVISEGANSSSLKDLFRGNASSAVMKINGSKVEPKEFQRRIKEYETLMAIFNPKNTLDEAGRAQLSEQVLQNTIMETVVGSQCDKLGITTTEEEQKELIYGANADQLVRRFSVDGQPIFNNPETNTFDPQRVREIEKQLSKPEKGAEQLYEKISEQWETLKGYVLRMNRINKFNSLITGSVFSPVYMAKYTTADRSSLASIRYVKVPYTSIPDNNIKVSDEDIKKYMEKHKGMFKNDQESRTLEFVSFDIVPSSADTARAVNTLYDMKADFKATKEADEHSFVNSRSDDPNSYTEAFINKKMFTSQFADSIMGLQVGEIFGPYLEGGNYKITKVVTRKSLPDSVKIRHILIKTKDRGNEIVADTIAKMRIDSIVTAIKGGVSFDSMVVRYSDDQGSNKNGGVYEWSLAQKAGIVKEFGDFIYEGKTGEKKTIKVESGNYSGYHYIEIMKQKDEQPAIRMSTIVKNLLPSDSTVNALYAKANDFASRLSSANDFDNSAKKNGYDKKLADNVKVNNYNIPGLGSSREVVRWTFDHKAGDVSPVFQLGDQRYVVAKLSSITEKGVMNITPANRPMLEQRVRDEKKAEEIIKQSQGKTSLDAIAAATNQQVQQYDSVALGASFIPNLGYEPKVVGYTFYPAFQPNTVSPGIKGQGGVYFITVLNRISKPEDQQDMQKIMQERYMQEMQLKNALGQQLQQAIPKMAEVKYFPANF